MALRVNEQALKDAAKAMRDLQDRNLALKQKLENMYKDLTSALDSPTGHAIEWTGKDVLVEPIDNMSTVLNFVASTLDKLVGKQGGTSYGKLFVKYDELDTTIKNKKTQ